MRTILQRQLTSNVVLTINYTGSEGHHLIALLSTNPGNPALCLSVSQTSQVAPGSPTCGPFGENEIYTKNDGTVINGTRAPFGNAIGSTAYFYNYGDSAYNSLQVTVNYAGKRATVLGGYTYGKSMDDASSFQEQLITTASGAPSAPSICATALSPATGMLCPSIRCSGHTA